MTNPSEPVPIKKPTVTGGHVWSLNSVARREKRERAPVRASIVPRKPAERR